MNREIVALLLPLVFLGGVMTTVTASCDGQHAPEALGEPFQVQGAQFIEGDLPGTPPIEDNDAGVQPVAPRVTVVDTANRVIRAGQVGKVFSGRTTTDSQAVALRFSELGSGYWVLPIGAPDPSAQGELTWTATCAFSPDLLPGLHHLRLAAIDASGRSGTQEEVELCVPSPIPDNLNACVPTIAPPAAVISLDWDTPVDLDLGVKIPSGKLVNAKAPSTAPALDGGVGVGPIDTSTGVLDQDGLAGCTPGVQRENLVWQTKPAPGYYAVYAGLFDACGQDSVRFTASVYLAEPQKDGTQRLVKKLSRSGELLKIDASGGANAGLFVLEFTVQ